MASTSGAGLSLTATGVSVGSPSFPSGSVNQSGSVNLQRAIRTTSNDNKQNKDDSADLSQAALALYQIQQQIRETSSTGFAAVLNGAAHTVRAQAQSASDPGQAAALENLAARLQAASTSGVGAFSQYSLVLLLGT